MTAGRITDLENMTHLEECPGCERCEFLLEFYSGCGLCGNWLKIRDVPHYDEATGEYVCESCWSAYRAMLFELTGSAWGEMA